MIESYKIAVNMTLVGDAHKKMGEFSKLVDRAAKGTESLQKSLRLINNSFNKLNQELNSTNPLLSRLLRTFNAFGFDLRTTNRSMNYFNDSLRLAQGNASRLKFETDTLRNSMRSLSAASREARNNVNSMRNARVGGGGGKGGGGLLNEWSYAGIGAAAGAAVTHRLAPAAAAYGSYRLGKSAFMAGAEYNTGIAQLKAAGYSDKEISEVRAYTEAPMSGVSEISRLNAYRKAAMATQSHARAMKLAPILLTGSMYAQRIGKEFGTNQMGAAISTAEMIGGSDEEKVAKALGTVLKMFSLSQGNVSPEMMRQVVNRNAFLTEEGLLTLEPVIQEMGGNRVGTGLRTGLGQLSRGTGMGKTQVESFRRHGWLKPQRFDTTGRPLGFRADDFKYLNEYRENPQAFLRDIVLPTYKKEGITSFDNISKQLGVDFARTTADIFSGMLKAFEKTERIRERIPFLKDITALGAEGAPESKAMQNFDESMKKFRKSLSNLTDPTITSGLNTLSSWLEKLAKVITFIDTHTKSFSESNKETTNVGNYLLAGTGLTTNTGITNTSTSSSSKSSQGNVYLDTYKVGKILNGHFTGNSQYTSDGTSNVNVSKHAIANTYNQRPDNGMPT